MQAPDRCVVCNAVIPDDKPFFYFKRSRSVHIMMPATRIEGEFHYCTRKCAESPERIDYFYHESFLSPDQGRLIGGAWR